MSIDNQIINRINLLRNEFQQNIQNENRILFGIRNILYNIDEINVNNIFNHLTYYYSNNNINLPNENIINFITNNNNNNNFYSVNDYLSYSLNTFDRNLLNFDQIINEPTQFENINNNIPNIFLPRNLNNYGYSYSNYINNWPDNNIFNYSNLFNIGNFIIYNNFESIEENIIENSLMTNVPIVIKQNSLDLLEKKLYKNLDLKLKNANKKCMINLRDFNEEDMVRILPCNHIFIQDDIDYWLTNNSYKCPICRCSAGEHCPKVN